MPHSSGETLSELYVGLQIAQQDFALTENYTVPKDTLLMPSITAASMQGFTEPELFDPERFSPERREDMTFNRNFLTFGLGPHACAGREYAINHLVRHDLTSQSFCQGTSH